MNKVLYLDFDGVLHHSAVFAHINGGAPFMCPEAAAEGYELFQHVPLLLSILPDDVDIVLSTSWANNRGLSTAYACGFLPEELRKRVVGRTGDVWLAPRKFRALSRGLQVKAHVGKFMPRRWLALDDDTEGFNPGDHFIETHWADGIQPVYNKIVSVFDSWKN